MSAPWNIGWLGEQIVSQYRTYHFDYRGSTVAITDGAGKVKERIEYSSYGRITQRTGSTTDTPFLFGGEAGVETDANGLYYMHARYYNPHLRRFINADPAGLAGGMNFYAYADGDPISMIDPSGLGATSADRNDQIRNDFMSAYNQKQAETAAAYKFTGYAGVKPEPITGRQMLDFALSFTPGGEAVKALYTSSTGRELGTGAWSQRSDGAVLLQGLVGAATLAPVFPAAGKAFGAIKAERQMLAHVRAEVTPRIFWTSGADLAKPAAQELAKRTGGLTIEMTTKGRLMNAITVGTPKPLRKVWNNTWDSLSKEFANGARGPVFIVHPSVRPISPRSTWMRIEKRELDSQGNKIIDHSF